MLRTRSRINMMAASLLLLGSLGGCAAKEAELMDLGIPSADFYNKFEVNARNPWEMIIEDDILYIGSGDYTLNTGPTVMWSYDIEQKEWKRSGAVADEAVIRFVRVKDKVIAPGTDPTYGWELGNYYVLEESGWEEIRTVPNAIHMYDIVEFDNGIFYGIGTDGDDVSPVQVSRDGDTTFEGIPFVKDGETLFGSGNYGRCRVYDFFTIGEDLYCLCQAHDSEKSVLKLTAIFQYEEGTFQYVDSFDPAAESSDNRQGCINEKVSVGDACFFTNGTLYKTNDFRQLETLSLPDDGDAEDLLVEYNPSTGEEEFYILGRKKEGEIYKNTIWKYIEDDNFKEVYSFEYELGAMSFVKYEEDFFIGIGQKIAKEDAISYYESEIGKVLQVHYE